MRIDFYVIEDKHSEASFRVASRLLEKAYGQGLRVWVWCENQLDASTLDAYLWTYNKHGFLPHSLAEHVPEGLNPPILISTHNTPQNSAFHILLNLRKSIPEHIEAFERVLDLVPYDAKDAGRIRYRAYRDLGFTLHQHTIY